MNNKRVSATVHVLLLALVLLSLTVFVLPGASARAETKVNFPDPNIRATMDLGGNLTRNISSLSSLNGLSTLVSLLNQPENISSLPGLGDPSELDSMLDQIVNTASSSGLGDLSELNPMIDLIVNNASFSSLSDLSSLNGLNLGQSQKSDISSMSTSAPAGKKNIWLIVCPIAIVTVMVLLVDQFLTLRERHRRRRLRCKSSMR